MRAVCVKDPVDGLISLRWQFETVRQKLFTLRLLWYNAYHLLVGFQLIRPALDEDSEEMLLPHGGWGLVQNSLVYDEFTTMSVAQQYSLPTML